MRTVYTNCRICLANCGIEVTVDDGNRIARIAPDKQNPYTWRDFCAKARTAAESVEHPRRIRTPMRRVGDRYVEATWAEAISDIARRLRVIRDQHGPDAIGMYIGNPAFFSSSNPVFASAFLDGVGTRNRYSALSVDSNSFHVVAEALYGNPLLVLPPDIDNSRCFLLVGMNPAASAMGWVTNAPNGWRRVLAAQARGADLIVVDPRRTATAEKANTHLAVRPGQDWALLLGLLKVILDKGWEHQDDCAALNGFDTLRGLVGEANIEDLSRRCGIPSEAMVDVARRFAHAETGFCDTHTGVSQHTTGTLAEWFSHLLNLVTGRIDRPGGRRYERGYVDLVSLWDKMAPAQKGRSRVRGLPAVAGYQPIAELADEIITPGEGQIRALIINAGNPVVTGPNGPKLDAALAQLDLLVAVDLVQRESHRHADWLIPDTHWLERDDLFAMSSQLQELPFVQYSPQAVEPPPEIHESWQFFTDLALAMKVPMFGYRGTNGFIRFSRLLARATGRPALAFNPRWVWRILVASGRRLRWKDIMAHPHGWIFGDKEFGQFRKALKTSDGKVHAAPPALVAEAQRVLASPVPQPSPERPFTMVSKRHHDTMNSWLGDLPGIRPNTPTNDVEINPLDAERLGVKSGDLVRVTSLSASIELPATVSDAVSPGVVVIEQGWGTAVFDPSGAAPPNRSGVNRNALVSDTVLDPLSQIPALNSERVAVEAVAR